MNNQRKILFEDHFDGTVLDTTYWNPEVTGASSKDLKRYTARPENVRVENGNLVITALREDYLGGKYTSASIATNDKFSFLYGRAEMRARLPYGQGVWPAFWTLGNDYLGRSDYDGWPYAGEIDIMEFIGVGGEEQKYNLEGIDSEGCEAYKDGRIGNNRSTCNLHWGADRSRHEFNSGEHILPSGIFTDEYHIFAIEWTKEKIEFFVDDTYVYEVDINRESMMNAFHKPHWLIVNLGLVEGWGPEVSELTPFPQSYYIDYIRVYAPDERA